MMRISACYAVFLSMVFPLCLHGQSIQQSVIGSAGGEFNKANASVSWTIGEVMTETYVHSNAILTQGFHQGNLIINRTEEESLPDLTLKAYPNPVVDILLIESPVVGLKYRIIDVNGKVISNGIFDTVHEEMDFSNLPPGMYFLSVDQKIVYKITKQ